MGLGAVSGPFLKMTLQRSLAGSKQFCQIGKGNGVIDMAGHEGDCLGDQGAFSRLQTVRCFGMSLLIQQMDLDRSGQGCARIFLNQLQGQGPNQCGTRTGLAWIALAWTRQALTGQALTGLPAGPKK